MKKYKATGSDRWFKEVQNFHRLHYAQPPVVMYIFSYTQEALSFDGCIECYMCCMNVWFSLFCAITCADYMFQNTTILSSCKNQNWGLYTVPVQKLCVDEYIYIYMLLYMSCFLWFTNCVLLSDDNSLIPGCLWLLAFVLNNTLILGISCSTIPHLPGCFCPWTFFQNIGFNMVPSDPFMSHLATQLGYSAGEFQALQLIVLTTFAVVD